MGLELTEAPPPPDPAEAVQTRDWRTLKVPVLGEIGRLLRFGLVGGGLFVLDLGIFLGLVEGLAASVALAQFISVTIRSIVGFFAHKWFTFRGDTADDAKTTAGQTVAYILQGVLNIPLSTVVVVACVWLFGGWELAGKLLGEVLMILEVYLLYRFIVFGRGLFGK